MEQEKRKSSEGKGVIYDDAMEASTVQYFTNLSEYVHVFGNMIDRIGNPGDGGFFHVLKDKKKPPSFESRSLPSDNVCLPYYVYTIVKLPPYCIIKTGVVAPWFGFEGGAQQVQIINPFGVVLTAADLLALGALS